jgi:hypothetical protein
LFADLFVDSIAGLQLRGFRGPHSEEGLSLFLVKPEQLPD